MIEQAAQTRASGRIAILDGWRALSILLVLAGHLLPLGPKTSDNNAAVAAAGMAIFFTLSGFLITRFLLVRPEPVSFLIRRLVRIVPLAWLAMLVLIIANQADARTAAANLLFVANLKSADLMHGGEHLWSLCVEVQFYLGIALLVALAGRRGLFIIPALCAAVTIFRIVEARQMDIVTWFRLDEILSGATLAMIYTHGRWNIRAPKWLSPALLVLLFFASNRFFGPLNYARPYVAAAAVGVSLIATPALMQRLFTHKVAVYIAEVSYAVYVFHGMLSASWLGTGDTVIKYAKRIPLFIATFGAAHASTFWFEHPLQDLGKRLTARRT